MENASKALIIAGAILLAIVIISLGLVVVNNSRNVTDNANLSEQEIQSFNAKFTSYEGDNVSGSTVNSLIQQVISTNQSSIASGDNKFVGIVFNSVSSETNPFIVYVKKYTNAYKISYYQVSVDPNNPKKCYETTFFKEGTFTNSNISDTTTNQLSVKTGRNYKVQFKYEDGLVKRIAVDPV